MRVRRTVWIAGLFALFVLAGILWQAFHRAPAASGGLQSLNQKPARLVYGQKATIVMLMATWCKYCAYDDRYVWPALIHTPGVTLDIVNVSPYAGIGNPGPQNPPFSGQDEVGARVGAAGMAANLRRYLAVFHLQATNIHPFIDPEGVSHWNIQYFPTILFINRRGQLVTRSNGALTLPEARRALAQTLKS